jgi:hypothetical protein
MKIDGLGQSEIGRKGEMWHSASAGLDRIRGDKSLDNGILSRRVFSILGGGYMCI